MQFKLLLLCVYLALFLGLTHCGKPSEPPSNEPTTNLDGKNELNRRMAKTSEIKEQFEQVNKAIGPASTMVSDLAATLAKEDGTDSKSAEEIQKVLDLIQKILKQSTEGLVQYLSDGSWILERSLKLPGLTKNFSCPNAKILLKGRRENDAETLRLTAIGCNQAIIPVELANIAVVSKDNLKAELHLEKVSSLFSEEHLVGDSCSVSTKKNRFEITCKPLTGKTRDKLVLLNPLYFLSEQGSITSQIGLRIKRRNDSKLLLKATLDARPGMPTKIQVSTKED